MSKQSAFTDTTASSSKDAAVRMHEGEEVKQATIKDVQMKVTKLLSNGNEVDLDSDHFADIQIEFIKFNMSETVREAGYDETVSGTIKDGKNMQKLQLQLGGKTFEVPVGGKLSVKVQKGVVELPAKGLVSMQYRSGYGGLQYVDEHPVEVVYGSPKSGGCCVIA